MVSSVLPCVSASVGTGYISAVSMKLMPYSSTAISSCCTPSSSVFCLPQVMVPKQTSLTMRSLLPSRRLRMGVPALIVIGARSADAPAMRSKNIISALLDLCVGMSTSTPVNARDD